MRIFDLQEIPKNRLLRRTTNRPLTAAGCWMLLVATALSSASSAQIHDSPSLDPELAITQYIHDVWTAENGLPQNSVSAVVRTSDGYLWLGTQDGLVRFDGMSFRTYGRSDGLGHSEIRALHPRAKGGLWIGTYGGGLSLLSDERITTYTQEDGLPNGHIRSLFEDSRGTLWIGTIEGGLVRFDGSRFTTYTSKDGLAGNVVLAFEETPDGALWIATQAGLSRLHDESFSRYTEEDGLPASLVWDLEVDSFGDLWIGTDGGLARYREGSIHAVHPDDKNCGMPAGALYADPYGPIWIGTLGGGLCRYYDGSFDNFNSRHGLSDDRVWSIVPDREGNLWIGTESGGLNRLRQGKFTHIAKHEGIPDEMIFAVLEDHRGNMWMGTKHAGLIEAGAGGAGPYRPFSSLPGDAVYALHEGPSRDLWVGMYGGGSCRITPSKRTCYGVADGLPSENVYAVHEQADGTVWMGTDAGLAVMREGQIRAYHGDPHLATVPITVILGTRAGAVWVGSYGGGLSLIHQNHATHLSGATELKGADVLVMHEDDEGHIWAGTHGGGLCRIENDTAGCLTMADGLPSDVVLQILDDGRGGLWLGTMRGIVRLTMSEAVRAIRERPSSGSAVKVIGKGRSITDQRATAAREVESSTLEIREFGRSEGLKATELNGGTQPAAWRSADGRLWFATNRGVAVIDPSSIRRNPIPPEVVVEAVMTDDGTVEKRAGITFRPGTKDVTIRYAGISLAAPELVRFQYKLEGYDERWVDAGSRREAYYTNLTPGDYRFEVRAANADNVWSTTAASISFNLEPHFYETWWFRWMAAAACIVLTFISFGARIHHLKERERRLERVVDERTADLRREKERTEESKRVIEKQAEKLRELDRFKTKFFANVSHEFRTPLTMIVGPLESMLSGESEPISEPTHRRLEIMLRNALRLMRLINQLLDLSKLEDGKMRLQARARNVIPFLDGIVQSCQGLAERKGLTLEIHCDSGKLELCYEPDKLEKVFYNLLSNAAKFTNRGGRIDVFIDETPADEAMDDGGVRIRVRDTGRGIPEEQLPSIFDRFHQVDGSNTREFEGTGIGLSLARELVLLHKGTIDVKSRVGEGTEFIVTLPKGRGHLESDQISPEVSHAERGDEADGQDAASTESSVLSRVFDLEFVDDGSDTAENWSFPGMEANHGGGANGTGLREENGRADPAGRVVGSSSNHGAPDDPPLLLIVDDNRDVREYVASVLGADYRIVLAADGVAALTKAEEVRPDLILSDVMMPKMDGNELCRRIKTSPDLNHIPVILLTARATHILKLEGLEVGADDYLSKPFNVEELRVRVRNLLILREKEKELKELNDHLEAKVQEQFQLLVEERRRYEQELIDAKERAEASDRLKSNILNNLSHEFRTPLTAIMGFSQIIETEGRDIVTAFAGEIISAGRRLLRTLDSLLHLSRVEAEMLETAHEVVDVASAAHAVVEGFRESAGEKMLELSLEAESHSDFKASLDPSALSEIISNVLDNAVKFTAEGGIAVRVVRDDRSIVIRIEDTGVGMDKAFVPRVFDAFVQESEGLTRSFEGCGLGLTVAKRLTEAMGGTISVESEKGSGSVFSVRFPAAAVDSSAEVA